MAGLIGHDLPGRPATASGAARAVFAPEMHVTAPTPHVHYHHPGPRTCETVQCRHALQRAHARISRLEGLLSAAVEALKNRPVPVEVENIRLPEPDTLAAPPTEPKAYAPDPVGKPTERDNEIPAEEQDRPQRINYFYLTNSGEFLDVVA